MENKIENKNAQMSEAIGEAINACEKFCSLFDKKKCKNQKSCPLDLSNNDERVCLLDILDYAKHWCKEIN